MKTINISLDEKSIDDAIKELEKAKQQLQTQMLADFRKALCEWIVERANLYLEVSSIGYAVINDIKSHWEYPANYADEVLTIRNTSDKAVFVEFGVGRVGQSSPHYLAGQQGYEYSIGEKINQETGQWIFSPTQKENIDLKYGYWVRFGHGAIGTSGSPATMYAYNAVVDALTELRSPDGGEIGRLWKEVADRYW